MGKTEGSNQEWQYVASHRSTLRKPSSRPVLS